MKLLTHWVEAGHGAHPIKGGTVLFLNFVIRGFSHEL